MQDLSCSISSRRPTLQVRLPCYHRGCELITLQQSVSPLICLCLHLPSPLPPPPPPSPSPLTHPHTPQTLTQSLSMPCAQVVDIIDAYFESGNSKIGDFTTASAYCEFFVPLYQNADLFISDTSQSTPSCFSFILPSCMHFYVNFSVY